MAFKEQLCFRAPSEFRLRTVDFTPLAFPPSSAAPVTPPMLPGGARGRRPAGSGTSRHLLRAAAGIRRHPHHAAAPRVRWASRRCGERGAGLGSLRGIAAGWACAVQQLLARAAAGGGTYPHALHPGHGPQGTQRTQRSHRFERLNFACAGQGCHKVNQGHLE